MRFSRSLVVVLACAGGPAWGQSPANLVALEGLAPVSALLSTPAGRVALGANLAITGAIQTGELRLPTLLPFEQQQALSLRDAFITSGNATELADGLGTRLGGIYQQKAAYQDWHSFTSASENLATLFAYTNATTASDSNSGKYFFANATTNGRTPVSDQAASILVRFGGVTDVFGKAYGKPAGSPGADPFGNSRPFQTEPRVLSFAGSDYFGGASTSTEHLSGPAQDLRDSPSFPSGHTTYGTMEAILLALLVPERYPQMVVRAAEYGNDRILVGAHYTMDVIAGRALALHDVAHLLANDPLYVGVRRAHVTVTDYPAALAAARADLSALFRQACGGPVAACAAQDTGRFSHPVANQALIDSTLTYNLPVVYPDRVDAVSDVNQLAPEAGHLLTAAYPFLSLQQANDILTATLVRGGGFLDSTPFGIYARLNLYAASLRAAAMAPRN